MRARQARGRPQEAAGDVRALLTLLRENEAAAKDMSGRCHDLLRQASERLNILNPELGDRQLLKSVVQMGKVLM